MKYEKVKALKAIVEEVCDIDISFNSKERAYVNARAICYKILRDTEKMSYQFIGSQFRRHHATIMSSIKDFRYLIISDRQMERNYNKSLAIWNNESDDYQDLTPLEIKKLLKNLAEENKLLHLSLKEVERKLNLIK